MKFDQPKLSMWKNYLFGPTNSNLEFPHEKYLSYVTPYLVTQSVIKHAEKLIPGGLKNKIVWDLFAGIGTDAILFAPYCLNVIATEINKETYTCAIKNTSSIKNIHVENTDCTAYACSVHVAYCDPPWGPSFKTGVPFTFENERLTNGQRILDLIKQIPCDYLILKSPLLCDSFETLFPSESILHIALFTQQKLKFIFIKKRSTL